MAGPASTSARPDAQRNYDHLLEMARSVFAEQGTQASLRDVARRAGVGLGTLYRHFPTRDDLVEALMRTGFERLVLRADELAADGPVAAALSQWLLELARGTARYRGLASSMVAKLQDPQSSLYASCVALHDAGGRLLVRAQRAGDVRSDVTAEELFTLVAAVASTSEQTSVAPDHLLAIVMDGLRRQPR